MKILSWNVRGAGRKGFHFQLKRFFKYCNPDIILLLETKVQFDKVQKAY